MPVELTVKAGGIHRRHPRPVRHKPNAEWEPAPDPIRGSSASVAGQRAENIRSGPRATLIRWIPHLQRSFAALVRDDPQCAEHRGGRKSA